MRRSLLIVLMAVSGMLTALSSLAWSAQAGEGGGRSARPPDTLTASELIGILDGYAIAQAQQALSLEDAQYIQFATRLKRMQDLRRRNQRQRQTLIQELRKLAGSQVAAPIDEAAVAERLKLLREHDERAAAELRTAYDALDEVLDIRQRARFRLFEENIERRKLDLLVRARERAAKTEPKIR